MITTDAAEEIALNEIVSFNLIIIDGDEYTKGSRNKRAKKNTNKSQKTISKRIRNSRHLAKGHKNKFNSNELNILEFDS